MRTGLRAAALLALAAEAAANPEATPPGAAAAPAAAFEQVQRELEAHRARLQAAAMEEQGILGTLEEIDRKTEQAARGVRSAGAQADSARAALARSEAEAQRLADASAVARRALRLRAVQLYREGRSGPLRYLAGAHSLRDLLSRARSLRRGFEHDARLFSRVRAEGEALARARSEAAASARESAAATRVLVARVSALDAEREAKRGMLARLRADGDRERSTVAELEAASKALEATLRSLGAALPEPAARPATEPFPALQGRLPPPVLAPVARRFGRVVNAEFRTATFRKGIDFAAPAGETVRAVAPGGIRFAGWFRGYGRMVIIDHGEGWFTVCAHLDEVDVSVGDAVTTGQRLGTVGDTGSLAGPLLYFEIRRGSEPVDPTRWLAGVVGLE